MMKQVNNFIRQFGTTVSLEDNLIVEKQSRYYLLSPRLKELIAKDFFYAGTYLGKVKDGVFFPSFILLSMIEERKEANKTMVDEKTEWLFIVGRDIFKQGITKVIGSRRRGDYTLVVNQHDECLGFGKIARNLDQAKNRQVVVKNISDIGDFLRREKQRNYR